MTLHSDTAARPRVRTTVGVPVGHRPRLSPTARAAVRRQLEGGPSMAVFERGLVAGAFLAAFDAGLWAVRDIAGERDRAHLVQVEDDELVDAIDRDGKLVRDFHAQQEFPR